MLLLLLGWAGIAHYSRCGHPRGQSVGPRDHHGVLDEVGGLRLGGFHSCRTATPPVGHGHGVVVVPAAPEVAVGVLLLEDGVVDLADGLSEDKVLAVDDKVEGAVHDDEEVIDDDQVLGPHGELDALTGLEEGDHLVDGDDDLADVADEEEDDDADEHEGDGAIALLASAFLFTRIPEKDDRSQESVANFSWIDGNLYCPCSNR